MAHGFVLLLHSGRYPKINVELGFVAYMIYTYLFHANRQRTSLLFDSIPQAQLKTEEGEVLYVRPKN